MTSTDQHEATRLVEDDRMFVKALDKGLAVIRAFDGQPSLRITEVARATGLSRAAARRFLMTLVRLGYARLDGQQFSLRPRVLDLGFAFLSSSGLAGAVRPHLDDLAGRLNQFVAAAVLDGRDIRLVACSTGRRLLGPRYSVGARMPAHATAGGHVLLGAVPLAELEKSLESGPLHRYTAWTVTEPRELRSLLRATTAAGYCLTAQLYEEGLADVAVPLHRGDGTVVAALMVSFVSSGDPMEGMRDQILPALQQAAKEAERDLSRYEA